MSASEHRARRGTTLSGPPELLINTPPLDAIGQTEKVTATANWRNAARLARTRRTPGPPPWMDAEPHVPPRPRQRGIDDSGRGTPLHPDRDWGTSTPIGIGTTVMHACLPQPA